MIGWKTIITTISVLTYVVLLHTFYELHFGRDESEVNCEWHSPCIRFCSEDRNETKQLLIKFNQEFIRDGRENNYSIHKSEPSCLDTTVNYGKSNYRIDAKTGRIVYMGKPHYYTLKEYCIERDADESSWNLKVCERDGVKKVFHIITNLLCLLLLAFVILTYGFHKELRDTYGKFLILFLLTQFIMYAVLPIPRLEYFGTSEFAFSSYNMIMITGLVFSFLWLSALCWHNSFRLRKFNEDQVAGRFLFYAVIAIILGLALSAMLSISWINFDLPINIEMKKELQFYSLIVAGVILLSDIICLLISAFLLIKNSRKLEDSNQKKFFYELIWFLSILIAFAVTSITWFGEYLVWLKTTYYIFRISLSCDLIKLFGAINIFTIFIMRKNVKSKLVYRYRQIRSNKNEYTL